MIKSKKITVAGFALIALMTSNFAFSAEYMMCAAYAPKGGSGLPATKNDYINCEGPDWKTSVSKKLDQLVSEGWKIEHMSTVGEDSSYRTIFLMRKD